MIFFNFFCVEPYGEFKNGIFFLLSILLILVLAESFDNFSIGQIVSIKREIKNKEKENKKLEQRNTELISHIISITNTQTQKLPFALKTNQGRPPGASCPERRPFYYSIELPRTTSVILHVFCIFTAFPRRFVLLSTVLFLYFTGILHLNFPRTLLTCFRELPGICHAASSSSSMASRTVSAEKRNTPPRV